MKTIYLDGTWPKNRYWERREGIQTQLEAIKAELVALRQVVRTDMNRLFAIADGLNASPLDDDEWREIVTEMVERVVIGGKKKIEVHWKPTWQPLFDYPQAIHVTCTESTKKDRAISSLLPRAQATAAAQTR